MAKKYYNVKTAPKWVQNNDTGIVNTYHNGIPIQYNLPTYDEYGETIGHGTEKYPYKLDEVTVYPNIITLSTFNPLHPNYLPGHSRIIFTTQDPELKNSVVNTRMSDPNYKFITNNCSDDTRKVLEATFGIPLDYNFFTTPGDVRDYFKERGAITKKRRNLKSPNTTQIMTISKDQYKRGLATMDSINAPRKNKRLNRK